MTGAPQMTKQELHMLEQIAYCETSGLTEAARILRKQLAESYQNPAWPACVPALPWYGGGPVETAK